LRRKSAVEADADAVAADPPANEDELDLIARLRAGDEAAFAELVETYGPSLLRLAMTYVPNREVAEDVVQETWMGVLGGIDRFEGRSSLRTWIFRILTNRAQTRGKREARSIPFSSLNNGSDEDDSGPDLDRLFVDGQHWANPPSNWDEMPEEQLLSSETLRVVREAIDKLPGNQRRVITMRDIDQWSSEEVRSALGITETNQRVLLHRARAKVRHALEQYLEGGN
jgi:RNA polymerase sigma-70 factor (ECF subfamily)